MARLEREYEDDSIPWGDYVIYSNEGKTLKRFPDNDFGHSQAEAYYREVQHLENQEKIIAQNQAIIDANKRPSFPFPPPRSRQELDPEYQEWLQYKKETDPKFQIWKIQKEQKEFEAKLRQAELEREERLKREKEVEERIALEKKHEQESIRRKRAEERKRAQAIEAERRREDAIIDKIKECTSKSMFKAVLPLCNTNRLRDEWYKRAVNNRYLSRSKAVKLLEEAYPTTSVSQYNNTLDNRVNNRKKKSPLSIIFHLIMIVFGLLMIYYSIH